MFRSGMLAALEPLLVRVLPLPRVLSMLQPRSTVREPSCSAPELARIADALVRRGPRFGVGECLIRSLVRYHLLRRFAHNAVLLIGGRLDEGRFEGHCWIEIDGQSLCESNDPRGIFKTFYRFEI